MRVYIGYRPPPFCTLKEEDHREFSIMSTDEEQSSTANYIYDSSGDYEDELRRSTECIQFGALANPLFFWVVFVLSLFGNILVLVILAKYENLRSLTNTFILNLALSDLVFTVGLPFWADYHVHGWRWGQPTCKAISFVFSVGFYSSGLFLIMMTIHRYLAVIRPLSGLLWTGGCFGLAVSMVIWTVSVAAASPALFFSKVQTEVNHPDQVQHCGFEDAKWRSWGFYEQNALFVLSFLVFSFCYGQILVRLLKPSPNRSNRRHRTVKLIFCLVVVFFVVWAPYNVVIFLKALSITLSQNSSPTDSYTVNKLNRAREKLDCAFYVCRLICFSHCCLNPIFYVFLGVKFKNHLKCMLQSLCQKKNGAAHRNFRHTITSITSGEELSL